MSLAGIRLAILKRIAPVLRFINVIHLPKRRITSANYREAKSLLKPGMVLLSHADWNATNLFIPDYFKHGAIYAGENTVIEALGEGVVKTDLIDFLLSKDCVCILTPVFGDEIEMRDAAAAAGMMVGSPYDYEFRSNNKAFYCFELVYAAYREAHLKRQQRVEKCPVLDWDLRCYMGEETVTAQDFLKAVDKWKVVWCNEPKRTYRV